MTSHQDVSHLGVVCTVPEVNILIVHNGGAVSSHGFLLDDTDELEGAAERGVRVWPFRALEMSHLQHVVVLLHMGEEGMHPGRHSTHAVTRDSMEHVMRQKNGYLRGL